MDMRQAKPHEQPIDYTQDANLMNNEILIDSITFYVATQHAYNEPQWMILAEALFWLEPSIKARNFMTGNQ
jgi:hypothetical protein